ncbi:MULTISPECIES: HlyD family type I secretion periplasmic adaptor subunit [unclassified Wenzhouxiangella]|uniref:HlyD family type I secretion periplasmic adaptor subunit n=1 Tax=unclassified Wenzhouxiangella TaxID=2613841 RepID=UPI000E32701D|nr:MULTISPECIES: HlyD family type I secretion periplasmic adaptor subunit [unclassified Wenzhouxiangella]RFF26505.1 HlyD family type I secretion periplasmic adaptor subunit [Wenzhouxiangella sp. 15181]RFP69698.1 HlyD family type I secretion periplasmic adaptor subunit [Wenzhouxiangella sp. 15190]
MSIPKQNTKETATKKTFEQKQFEALGGLQKANRKQNGLIDRLFSRWVRTSGRTDWISDIEWARIMQEPLRARTLLYGVMLSLIALCTWASVAEIDEVTRGQGSVIPSRQLQTLQSLDGGMVEEILVSEGQVVEQGDLLVRVDPVRFKASLGESRAQYLALTAEVTRLRALVAGIEPIFPPELVEEAPELMEHEMRLYRSTLEELSEQQEILSNQLEQRQQELEEARAAVSQYTNTLRLTRRELEVTRPLLESGAVSDVDVLRLERQIATIEGELSRARAAVARSEAAVSEARNNQREAELAAINRWQNKLSDSRSRLAALTEAGEGLEDMVRQAEIRSPMRGIVRRLHVNTVGGVLTPGQEVIDIVPLDDQLMIEARIQPRDIAFIRPQQEASVRLTAYDWDIYGSLDAHVEHISASTITDERDNTYYLVRLVTEPGGYDDELLIIPGMTAEVDILTGKRTIMRYLLNPLLRAGSKAFTER